MQPAAIHARLALTALLCGAAFEAHAQLPVGPPGARPTAPVHDATLAEYRQHLQDLTQIVEACAKARDTKTCDPDLVGPDDRIPLKDAANTERRLIRYDWARALLARARLKEEPAKSDSVDSPLPGSEAMRPPLRTTVELLRDAETRLDHDLTQAGGSVAAPADHGTERSVLGKVLAGREFSNLEQPSARDTVLERIGNWLNRIFNAVSRAGAHAGWIARVVVWGLLGAVCVGLVWGLIQLERRWRIRLVPDQGAPAPDAASARDWQLWLEDARRAAAAGRWREAIHFVYWASISRLESKRLWPADRARTPREYLALVAEEDPRRAGLATLTGSFERIWYGGRTAVEKDYRAAEQLARALISTGATGGGGAA